MAVPVKFMSVSKVELLFLLQSLWALAGEWNTFGRSIVKWETGPLGSTIPRNISIRHWRNYDKSDPKYRLPDFAAPRSQTLMNRV
jgi:hypothetical protein